MKDIMRMALEQIERQLQATNAQVKYGSVIGIFEHAEDYDSFKANIEEALSQILEAKAYVQ